MTQRLSFLAKVQGNARGCLIYEPMWVIPWSMFSTYASVYMLQLGLTDTQIGWVTSLGLALQIIGSLISGDLTDRLGRKRALLYFDLISWSCATFLWAISQNLWYFVAAAVLNSFQKIPNTAWYCLLVEDSRPEDRPAVFTVLQFIGVISGLFAPAAGLLVSQLGLVPAERLLYLLACASMTAMFLLRNRAVHETEMGYRKMQEASGISWRKTVADHARVIRQICTDRPLLLLFAVYILNNFQMTLRTTYASIYYVDQLRIPAGVISVFPAVTSAVMLVLMVSVVQRLREDCACAYMIVGFALSAASTLMLVISPPRAVGWVILSTILMAVGTLLATPYLETAVANRIDDAERAKTLSILTVLIMACTAPSGVIGGWTYSLDPRAPFVIVTAVFALASGLVWVLYRRGGNASLRPAEAAHQQHA